MGDVYRAHDAKLGRDARAEGEPAPTKCEGGADLEVTSWTRATCRTKKWRSTP
jgi:hypothetical protein